MGCAREEVISYQAPKEPTPAQLLAGDAPQMAQASGPSIDWKLPSGWEELPASQLRVGNFRIHGENNAHAEVSIIPLPGMAGGDVENVNRWRGQVGLQPLTQAELDKSAEPVMVGGGQGRLWDILGSLDGDKSKTRLLAAILRKDGTAWFFKAMGDDALVTSQKAVFVQFLKDVEFGGAGHAHNHDHAGEAASAPGADPHAGVSGAPPLNRPGAGAAPGADPHAGVAGAPPIPAAGAGAGAGMPAAEDSPEGLPKWTVPAGWQKVTPGPMQQAKFAVASSEGKAEASVVMLAGTGGGNLANVNRWRMQIALKAITEGELSKTSEPIAEAPTGSILVDMTNPDLKRRMVAAIVPVKGVTWFYKCVGDAAAVGAQKDAFVQFVRKAKYND